MDPNGLFASHSSFGTSPESHEDEFDDLGMLSDGDSIEQTDSAAGPKRKGRRLPSTAEKRANHNAIERARRESLNGRFMELARALPTMAVVKRPSKNSIVSKSLEFVRGARAREQALETENARLRSEVNELRAKLGMQAVETSIPTTVVSQAPTISAVKQEVQVSRAVPIVTAKPAAEIKPVISRHNSAPLATTPYLDPLAAASMYGFVDSFVKAEAASPQSQSSTSDSESSLAQTPPSSFHSFGTSPNFFFEETVHAPTTTTTFDNDFLAQCGLQSGFSPSWPLAAPHGFALGSHTSLPSFPLFA